MCDERDALEKAFEEGFLVWYREWWEEEPFPQEEWQEELEDQFWEEWEKGEEEKKESSFRSSWWEDIDQLWQDHYWSTVVRFG
jgi:hypothetical protein